MTTLPVAVTSVVVLGMVAQWLAWRLRFPSILLLLLFGFAAGRFIRPDELAGTETIFAFVSLSVATILLEGGLGLRLDEIRETRRAVIRLCTLGVLIAWGLTAVAARWTIGLDWRLAALLGALLVVTGPTVIGPLLRQIRPVRSVGAVARWEGIVVDPIGAILAVLVFQAILAARRADAPLVLGLALLKMALAGGLGGFLLGRAMEQIFKRHLVPDFLHSPVLLAVGLAAYVLANSIQSEVGLLTVTVLGITLANQRSVPLDHILEFKETLRVLLISSLFILLAARLELNSLVELGIPGLLFVAALIVVVRPLSVMVSTIGSGLAWSQRVFLSCLAPRGIVAAAVTSVFALEVLQAVEHHELPASLAAGAALLEPLAFMVIIGTVTFYGLLAGPIARRLRLAARNPQGVLFVGATPWVVQAAKILQEAKIDVMLIDTNAPHVGAARMQKLPALRANVLSRYVSEELELFGIGRLLAVTPNFEVNTLACQEFAPQFGRENVYQLRTRSSPSQRQDQSHRMRGRALFREGLTEETIDEWMARGARVKRTPLTEKFTYAQFRQRYGDEAAVLFVLEGTEGCRVLTEAAKEPRPGSVLVSLVLTPEEDPTPRSDPPAPEPAAKQP